MADWESFRDVLEDLYLTKDHTLAKVMKYMAETHNFSASKGQYQTKFQAWDWRKNLSEKEWGDLASILKEREHKPTAVYLYEREIPPAKIKKEISRNVRPTFAAPDVFHDTTSIPRGLVIRTPPPSSLVNPVTGNKRLLQDPSWANPPALKRQRTISIQPCLGSAREMTFYNPHPQSSSMDLDLVINKLTKLKLDNLPFFKFKQFMGSPDIKRGFEQIVNLNSNQADSFLSQSLSYHPQNQISVYDMNASDFDLDFESPLSYLPALEDPKRLYHSFGTEILQLNSCGEDIDASEVLETIRQQLPSFLINIPHKSQDEIIENVNILCGPPTMQAAQLFVELGVYFESNSLWFWGGADKLSRWMIENLPWPTIRPMLSVDFSTVQAFAERFLAVAVEIGNVVVVKDLLKISRLVTHVRSSVELLLIAVDNSHTEIVTQLLKEGSDVNGKDYYYGRGDSVRPLLLARTVEVARILIEAGADPNAVGYLQRFMIFGPALIMAIAGGHLQLLRYLIKVGAHVNTLSHIDNTYGRTYGKTPFTALSMAVDLERFEMVRLLLEEGADGNGVFARKPFSIRYSEKIIKSTSLHAAARSGNLEIARLLLKFGSDIDAVSPNVHGKTALEAARLVGHAEMVALLLDNGAKGSSDVTSTEPTLEPPLDEISQGRIELREAVLQDDLDKVKELVNAGVQIDMEIIPGSLPQNYAFDYPKFSPPKMVAEQGTILHWAICKPEQRDHAIDVTTSNLVKFLLSKIKDVNVQNKNAALRPILHSAIKMANTEVIKILVEAGVDINSTYYITKGIYETPLLLAARHYAYDVVILLIENGADVNAVVVDSLKVPSDLKPPNIDSYECRFTTAFQASLGRTPSLWSERQNNVIQCLLSHGATMNAPVADIIGRSELALAVEIGNTKLVQQLLDLGADVNRPPAPILGRTALQAAVELRQPNLEMVELLLRNGAHVNAPIAPYQGMTPLLIAVQNGYFQLARVLLEAGADPNTEGFKGELALEGAILYGRLDLAYLLLEAGADPQMPGHAPAAKHARDCGNIAIAEMIEEWIRTHEARDAGKDSSSTVKGKGKVIELD